MAHGLWRPQRRARVVFSCRDSRGPWFWVRSGKLVANAFGNTHQRNVWDSPGRWVQYFRTRHCDALHHSALSAHIPKKEFSETGKLHRKLGQAVHRSTCNASQLRNAQRNQSHFAPIAQIRPPRNLVIFQIHCGLIQCVYWLAGRWDISFDVSHSALI